MPAAWDAGRCRLRAQADFWNPTGPEGPVRGPERPLEPLEPLEPRVEPRVEPSRANVKLNLPPQYLLVHRVAMGMLGVLCQLDARVALREIVERRNPATRSDTSAIMPGC
jgi:hypothetical protein